MLKVITVTDMIRTFSDVIGRVYYKGESFDIKKGTNVVARLSPPKTRSTIIGKDLVKFFEEAPHLDRDDIDNFEACVKAVRQQKDTRSFSKWD